MSEWQVSVAADRGQCEGGVARFREQNQRCRGEAARVSRGAEDGREKEGLGVTHTEENGEILTQICELGELW